MTKMTTAEATEYLNAVPRNVVEETAREYYGVEAARYDGHSLMLCRSGHWYRHSAHLNCGVASAIKSRAKPSRGWIVSGDEVVIPSARDGSRQVYRVDTVNPMETLVWSEHGLSSWIGTRALVSMVADGRAEIIKFGEA